MATPPFSPVKGQPLCIPARMRDCLLLNLDYSPLSIGTLYDRPNENYGLILPDPKQVLPAMVLLDDFKNGQLLRSMIVWREGHHAGLSPLSLPQDTSFQLPELETDWDDHEEIEFLEHYTFDAVRWMN